MRVKVNKQNLFPQLSNAGAKVNGGSGFAYAYQYPGFNRVLQATGRLIRTESDRGIIVLMDERFTHARYRHLFPTHWRGFQVVQNTREIQDKLMHFWSGA